MTHTKQQAENARLNVELALEAAYDAGCNDGYTMGYRNGKEYGEGRVAIAAPRTFDKERAENFVRLVNSVGQACDAQTRLINGLANVFDNAGAVR